MACSPCSSSVSFLSTSAQKSLHKDVIPSAALTGSRPLGRAAPEISRRLPETLDWKTGSQGVGSPCRLLDRLLLEYDG